MSFQQKLPFTVKDVCQLAKETGQGIILAKKALAKTDGDMDLARDILKAQSDKPIGVLIDRAPPQSIQAESKPLPHEVRHIEYLTFPTLIEVGSQEALDAFISQFIVHSWDDWTIKRGDDVWPKKFSVRYDFSIMRICFKEVQ